MITEEIEQHLLSNLPNEACGIILKGGQFIATKNVANSHPAMKEPHDPQTSFAIPSDIYRKYSRLGMIDKIVHSHPVDDWKNNGPSVADQLNQIATAVPWTVVVISGGEIKDHYTFDRYQCSGSTYRPGVNDCLTPIERYHQLDRWPRERGWERSSGAINQYGNRLVLMHGFKPVDREPEPGDIILGSMDSDCPPQSIALVTKNGKFVSREPYRATRYSEKPPCPFLHRILARQ